MTPLQAIRAKCLDCCCGQAKEVRFCVCPDCSLFPFRFGKNPNRAGLTNSGSFSKTAAQQTIFGTNQQRKGNYTNGTGIIKTTAEPGGRPCRHDIKGAGELHPGLSYIITLLLSYVPLHCFINSTIDKAIHAFTAIFCVSADNLFFPFWER